MTDTLRALVAREVTQPVDKRVTAFATYIAGLYPEAARGVLFYGSCLRERALAGLMLDFYLIVSDYRSAYSNGLLVLGNALVPPNVFYVERNGLRAKYAVLSEGDFDRLNGPGTANVSVWARFAQPSRIVWTRDDQVRDRMIDAITKAAPTLLAAAGEQAGEAPLDWWRRAFALTYSAELRAERKGRATSVVDSDADRYASFSGPAIHAARAYAREVSTRWRWRRIEGKILSVLRLAKASMTFAGGADYIAWKINRHAGTKITLSRFERRHPFWAAIRHLPRLLGSGAVR